MAVSGRPRPGGGESRERDFVQWQLVETFELRQGDAADAEPAVQDLSVLAVQRES